MATFDPIVWINKPIGMTPAECVMHYKKINNVDDSIPIAFAGRLDPIAYGIMPLIIQPRINVVNIQPHYKTYKFKFISGIQTDTGDILGLVKTLKSGVNHHTLISYNEMYKEKLLRYICRKSQTIPVYSSKNIALLTNRGKNNEVLKTTLTSNFQSESEKLSNHPKVDDLKNPNRKDGLLNNLTFSKSIDQSIDSKETMTNNLQINIHDIDIRYINVESIITHKNIKNIISKITKRQKLISATHSFRYNEIIDSWTNLGIETNVTIFNVEACVSSGTYIRQLCDDCNGVAYDICRTGYGVKTDNVHLNVINPSKYNFKIY